MRTFEIPAANGFMLHEYSEEAEHFFKPDIEVVYFKSISDLVDKCILYLNSEEMMKEVRLNCQSRIDRENYTYSEVIKGRMFFLVN
jgi:spore maturation protein CgeB